MRKNGKKIPEEKLQAIEAALSVYELKEISLLKNLFISAYESSALLYREIRHLIGEPDRFLVRNRERLVYIIGEVIRAAMGRKSAFEHIENWAKENVDSDDRETFREIAENELVALHEGNCARYRVGLREFQAWQEVWNKKTL